jgi:hypothetical protein
LEIFADGLAIEIRRDDRVLYDSSLEGTGFELSVPRKRRTMLFEIGAVRFQPVSDLETRFRRVSQAFLLLYPHLFTPHDHG